MVGTSHPINFSAIRQNKFTVPSTFPPPSERGFSRSAFHSGVFLVLSTSGRNSLLPISFSAHYSGFRKRVLGLPNLAAREARTLQASPTLQDLPVGDPPDYDSEKIPDARSVPVQWLPTTTLSSSAIRSSMLTRRSGTFLSAAPTYCMAPAGPRGQSRWHVGPVIHKAGSKIHFTDPLVVAVHEFLKMIADELLHLPVMPVLGFDLPIVPLMCSSSASLLKRTPPDLEIPGH